MTGATGRMVLVVLGLLLALTYLLLRGSTPDAALHDRRLRAVDALVLNQAALQRDVLRASHGLLLNYDPLVATTKRLREAAEELRGAGAASGPLVDSIATGLDEQEALVEGFKSAHALLRNSRAYFAHLSRGLGASTGQAGQDMASAVGRLATSMLRFVDGPPDEAATAEVAALLDEFSALAAPAAALREDFAALRAHGGLILRTLPTVENILARLLATRISEQARALQGLFVEEHRRAETLAWIFRVLLYLASVLLLVYLGRVYARLRANVRALKARSDFEHLVASISAQLVDTPLDQTGHGVRQGLERLGRHTGVDRAYVVLGSATGAMDGGSRSWRREGMDLPGGWPDGALAVGSTGSARGYERHGCVDIPSVQAMPRSEEKSRLMGHGVRSWLCVPLWYAGGRVGLLGLDAVKAEKRWSDDDVALLRTIGEIFASALGREQAEHEKQALESRLRQAEKLKAVGTLASGIAHDFNNILATIFTSTEVALLHLAEDAPARVALGRVMGAGKRGRQLVAEILTFSRGERTPRVAIELGAAVAAAIELCRPALGGNVELSYDRPGDPIFVAADEAQVHQLVSNLCLNAAQAMPGGGRISVRVTGGKGGDGQRRATLRVADTGSGMDADTAARAFEPFFTTKPVGEGTGLGLAVVHGTVEALGGRVKLRTAPGRGSVFSIALPCIVREGADRMAPTGAIPPGQDRTIVLVEPDDGAAEAVGVMLRGAGYRVTRYADPSGALEAFSGSRRATLLVAALSLPALSGVELAAAMRLLAPGLGVVLLAPAPPTPAELAAAGTAGAALIGKPVLRRELAAALAGQLAESTEAPHRAAS
jgi:signal transduction histidine kinase/CheY-like chemotaxis protein